MSTPVEPEEIALARQWRLEVNLGTAAVPDWKVCPGITAFQPASEPNFEDSGDYDGEGWGGKTKTGQDWEISLTINRRISPTAKTFNAVHEAIRLAHFAYGNPNKLHVRYMDRTGLPEAYEGRAVPTWAPAGGERTALGQVEITLGGDGPLLPIDNPLATP
ncbi:phage tail tube protein [Streptomyces sp. NPDC098077]|uniref:phage tail tube protein n=1 Tax=Streptomyces sp. NPDC098077 TaxID=3366093 RepID=UPI0038004409